MLKLIIQKEFKSGGNYLPHSPNVIRHYHLNQSQQILINLFVMKLFLVKTFHFEMNFSMIVCLDS